MECGTFVAWGVGFVVFLAVVAFAGLVLGLLIEKRDDK
jgi:hypothetical protein